jgi:hypothetical protein
VARDQFVYVYSHDSDSEYKRADQMVLARVSHKQITERSAYEFFTGTAADGRPKWSWYLDGERPSFAIRATVIDRVLHITRRRRGIYGARRFPRAMCASRQSRSSQLK